MVSTIKRDTPDNAPLNCMHEHYNLIGGNEREEPTCKYLSMSTQIILFQCLLIPIHTIAVCNTVAGTHTLRTASVAHHPALSPPLPPAQTACHGGSTETRSSRLLGAIRDLRWKLYWNSAYFLNTAFSETLGHGS